MGRQHAFAFDLASGGRSQSADPPRSSAGPGSDPEHASSPYSNHAGVAGQRRSDRSNPVWDDESDGELGASGDEYGNGGVGDSSFQIGDEDDVREARRGDELV